MLINDRVQTKRERDLIKVGWAVVSNGSRLIEYENCGSHDVS